MSTESYSNFGLADALASQITQPPDYRPVERDGATRAAAAIADLI